MEKEKNREKVGSREPLFTLGLQGGSLELSKSEYVLSVINHGECEENSNFCCDPKTPLTFVCIYRLSLASPLDFLSRLVCLLLR